MKVLVGQAHLTTSTTPPDSQLQSQTPDNDVPADNLDSDFSKDGKPASYAAGYPLQWGQEVWKFASKGDVVSNGVTFGAASPDEKYLALSTGQNICIFALDDFELVCVLKSDFGQVQRVEFAPFPKGEGEGYVLATMAEDTFETLKQQVQLWFLDGDCKGPSISGDGNGNGRKGGMKWDGHFAPFTPSVFSHDGKTMLYLSDAHDDYGVHVQGTAVDATSGKETFHMTGHIEAIMWAGFSPNDKLIVSNAWDGYAKLYDAKDGKHIRDFGPTGGQNWTCEFSPNGENLAVSRGSGGPSTFIWQPEDPQSFPVTLQGTRGWQRVIAWSPDGDRLAIGAGDGRLVVYDAKSMTLEQIWQVGEMPQRWIREVSGIKWLYGGKRLMFTPMDGSVQMYDFEENRKWKWAPGEKDKWGNGSWFGTLTVMERRGLFGSKDQDGAYRVWKLPGA